MVYSLRIDEAGWSMLKGTFYILINTVLSKDFKDESFSSYRRDGRKKNRTIIIDRQIFYKF